MPSPQFWTKLEACLRRDPARRGVAGYIQDGLPLGGSGVWRLAVEELWQNAKVVGIATGFCVQTESGYTAETDGPPGALYLARTLLALDVDVALITDDYAMPLLEAGCDLWNIPRSCLHRMPFESDQADHPHRARNEQEHNRATDAWVRDFLQSEVGRKLTHLVAIERAGPSHTPASILLPEGVMDLADREDFERLVPIDSHNVCHNMRGESINAHTAKVHRLFEFVASERPEVRTIGIADGGNEIGSGRIPWHVLRRAIALGVGDRVACRIATDYTLLAGVSNWGGYGLAAALTLLHERTDIIAPWGGAEIRTLIETLAAETTCVDGVTRQRTATVDGLPLETYLQTLHGIRALIGLEDRS